MPRSSRSVQLQRPVRYLEDVNSFPQVQSIVLSQVDIANQPSLDDSTFVSGVEPKYSSSKHHGIHYENSFVLHVKPSFPTEKIKHVIEETLKDRLFDVKYEEEHSKKLSVELCNVLHSKVRSLQIPRYKFVCYVHMGQILGQEMKIASRCLWDHEMDNFAVASFQNTTLFATASVFGLYYE